MEDEVELLYKYHCDECNSEYISEDSKLRYCVSAKCVNKDAELHGPYLYDEDE